MEFWGARMGQHWVAHRSFGTGGVLDANQCRVDALFVALVCVVECEYETATSTMAGVLGLFGGLVCLVVE